MYFYTSVIRHSRPSVGTQKRRRRESQMKQHKILLIIVLALCIFSSSYSESKKEVKAVVEEFPNYIFHLLTLGKIVPEDSEYLSLYKDSISKKDQEYLYGNRNFLSWGDGSTGSLTPFFVFIPGYLNFQTQKEINEYFDLLSKTLKTGNFDVFISKYEAYFNRIKLMFGDWDIKLNLQLIMKYSNVVTRLSKIYKKNYQIYHLKVWPQEKEKLEKRAKIINTELQERDLINFWEKLFGMKFKTDVYQIVLFSANQKGPNANSLGYDRNAFYYNQDIKSMVQFISHEVGTHLLIDDLYKILKMNRFEYIDVYKAYENLVEFYNAKYLFDEKPLIGYDIEKYYKIYNDLYNLNKGINHKDLLIKVLEIYTTQKNR